MGKAIGATARRKARVRKSLRARAFGKPRLSVHRSSKQIYCQIIDDAEGRTLASASSLEKDQREGLKSGANIAAATEIGKLIAERAKKAGVTEVVFDRGAYMYHGRVKALGGGRPRGRTDVLAVIPGLGVAKNHRNPLQLIAGNGAAGGHNEVQWVPGSRCASPGMTIGSERTRLQATRASDERENG